MWTLPSSSPFVLVHHAAKSNTSGNFYFTINEWIFKQCFFPVVCLKRKKKTDFVYAAVKTIRSAVLMFWQEDSVGIVRKTNGGLLSKGWNVGLWRTAESCLEMSAAFQHVTAGFLLLLFQISYASPTPHQKAPGGLQLLHQPLSVIEAGKTRWKTIHQGVNRHPSFDVWCNRTKHVKRGEKNRRFCRKKYFVLNR